MDFPDHPVINNMERTGSPDGRDPEEPRCPVCGAAAETFFLDRAGQIVGCGCCLTTKEYWEIETEDYDV